MLTIGIDPGLTGAAGALNADGTFRAVFDLPVIRDRSLAWIDGASYGCAPVASRPPLDQLSGAEVARETSSNATEGRTHDRHHGTGRCANTR